MVSSGIEGVPQPAPKKSRYRPEIDGLRAIAVVAVIINHINKAALPSGYLGVDIFFVISGFVITASLAGRRSKNFTDFITGFYTRRIKRLIPALLLFVMRARGGAGMKGYSLIALAIFLVLGVLLLVNALSR